ncbi:hypothetical protein FUA23_20015 [Neolewinella aurantiaca]|uniref:Magnesium citrate secondary transporter n=1 Tax=Neolewinella aurantiaca TaxID=2602767 RepID=A0A5C7FIA5_9BACT|nr:hypothetical protein [Neolewinella aurantiaca]TXF86024.1 hypothetical protein FUA23_20015 [Neolewinella aurantiaca]
MKILRKPAWWSAAMIVVAHQVVQYGLDWQIPVLDAYLDPLLCLPVLLGLWLTERQWLFSTERLGNLEVVVAGLALAILFEEGFPRWQPAFVRDWWDYLAYAVGGTWFWWFINPKSEKEPSPTE